MPDATEKEVVDFVVWNVYLKLLFDKGDPFNSGVIISGEKVEQVKCYQFVGKMLGYMDTLLQRSKQVAFQRLLGNHDDIF
ncbi:hypothetical protein CK934_13830 [Chitinophaga sp. MD30]|nr:hypothetical protein CK934_13830 [Chitinophaga sp. MD30]